MSSTPRPASRPRPRGRKSAQLSFKFRTWGGAREGAGRPRTSMRMPHAKRPKLSRHVPCHVTLRLVAGLPSLRGRKVFRLVRQALPDARGRLGVVHYSVQSNHLHVLAEARNANALARGIQGLCIRLAKRLNALFRRSGRVFADRYHARPLKTPREVRNALVYVLNNFRRHADRTGTHLPLCFLDPCSSAGVFSGWHPQ